jgi:hypothetical protein
MRLQWNLTDTEILGSIEGSIGDGWMGVYMRSSYISHIDLLSSSVPKINSIPSI